MKNIMKNIIDNISPDGNICYAEAIDEHNKPVERTKSKFPYSYDGFITWRGMENQKEAGTVYSDRITQQDHKRAAQLMMKHFGNTGDYYDNRKPKAIESFLKDWFREPKLKLIFIMEYCNISSGYPVWRFDYTVK